MRFLAIVLAFSTFAMADRHEDALAPFPVYFTPLGEPAAIRVDDKDVVWTGKQLILRKHQELGGLWIGLLVTLGYVGWLIIFSLFFSSWNILLYGLIIWIVVYLVFDIWSTFRHGGDL